MFTGKREKMTSFKGINGAPSWSPDGRFLAVSGRDWGSVDVYLVTADGTRAIREWHELLSVFRDSSDESPRYPFGLMISWNSGSSRNGSNAVSTWNEPQRLKPLDTACCRSRIASSRSPS